MIRVDFQARRTRSILDTDCADKRGFFLSVRIRVDPCPIFNRQQSFFFRLSYR